MSLRPTILVWLLAGSTCLASSGYAAEPAPGACPRTFELVTPGDWHCEEEAAPRCTVCRNRSHHYTDLIIRCARDDTRERVPMPPGGRMEMCGGQEM